MNNYFLEWNDMPSEAILIKNILEFLDSISIRYAFRSIEIETFLPGLTIENGLLVIDTDKLENPGDILHEAGHIAVTLPEERTQLNANVAEGNKQKEGDELAVLLWSYAAAQQIGLPSKVVFHENGYKGDSTWLIDQFESKNYIGLPLLKWMGLAYSEEGEASFPKMKMWVRT